MRGGFLLVVVVVCVGLGVEGVEGMGLGDFLPALFGNRLEEQPVVRFIIFFAQRSGSKWLTTLLNNHENVICMHELLRKYANTNMSYFEKIDRVWSDFFGVYIKETNYDQYYSSKLGQETQTKNIKKFENTFSLNTKVGETEDGKAVFQVRKELPRAVGFKIPYSDGFWTQGKALRKYLIENKIRIVHLVRNNVVRRLISQISNRLDETYVKSKKRALESRKKIYSKLEEHEKSVEQSEEEKKIKKNQRKNTLNRLRTNIGAGHQAHPKTEEDNKKLQNMKPRISKDNFLYRLDMISEQLETAKEIMERWKIGIDEFGNQFEPIPLIEITYEDLVAYQKSSLYALEDFLSVPRYVNTTSSVYQIHSGNVKDLVREPEVLEEALIGTQYENFLSE